MCGGKGMWLNCCGNVLCPVVESVGKGVCVIWRGKALDAASNGEGLGPSVDC